VGSQTEIMQHVLQMCCLNIQNEFLGVFINVFAYVNIGHLKVKNGLGFNTIHMTICICEVRVQYIPMVRTASSLFNGSILCTYTTSMELLWKKTFSLARCLFLCV